MIAMWRGSWTLHSIFRRLSAWPTTTERTASQSDTGSMVRSTDRRMNARLNKIGYQLRIVKHAGGKVHWRVVVEPLGGKTCQEQSQI